MWERGRSAAATGADPRQPRLERPRVGGGVRPRGDAVFLERHEGAERAHRLRLLPSAFDAELALREPGGESDAAAHVGATEEREHLLPDAEATGAVWAREKDPRVTRVGRFLRCTHLDEFPQFWNILRGDMSAVGPRPERPEFVMLLEQEIPLYHARHAVRPGMAGLGLVCQGYGASIEDARRKLKYDLAYLRRQSLWLDLSILARTVLDFLRLGGR